MFDPFILEKYLIPFGSQVNLAGVKMPQDGMGFIVKDNNLNSLPLPRNGHEFKTAFIRAIQYEVSVIKGGEEIGSLRLPISRIRGHAQIPALEIWRLSSLIPYVRGRITAAPAPARTWQPKTPKECQTKEEKVANLFKAISKKAEEDNKSYDIRKMPKELRDLDDTFTFFYENTDELNINTIKSLFAAENYLIFCRMLYKDKQVLEYLTQITARWDALAQYISVVKESEFQYALVSE